MGYYAFLNKKLESYRKEGEQKLNFLLFVLSKTIL